MKAVQLLIMILWLCACNHTSPQNNIYEYPKLKNAFLESIVLSGWGSRQINVYNEFDNVETRDIVENIYFSFNEELNYSIEDSILDLISTRKNRQIYSTLIDYKDLSVNLISDTTIYEDYLIFSEPFSIDNRWMIYSLSRRDSASKTRKHYIFYVEKDEEKSQFVTPFVYDWQKDILLEGSVIK